VTGELDPWQLNLHTKMRSGGNGMWGRGPAQRKNNLKKNKKNIVSQGVLGSQRNGRGLTRVLTHASLA
jgi:hypothetical protein